MLDDLSDLTTKHNLSFSLSYIAPIQGAKIDARGKKPHV